MTDPKTTEEESQLRSLKPQGSFAGDVLKLAGGTTLAELLTVLAAPILSRIYVPSAFGTTDVFVSITGIIGVVACLRYELAMMLPERDEDAAHLLAISLCSVLMISGVSALCILLGRGFLVRLLKAPELSPYLWLLPIAVFARGVFMALSYWNSRTKRYGRLSVAHIAQSTAANGVQLAMGIAGQAHAGGLIGSRMLGQAVSSFGLGWMTWREDRHVLSRMCWKRAIETMKRYRKFPLVSTWSGLLNTLSVQLPTLLLSAFFTQTVVGYYAFGSRMIQLPMILIGNAIGQVFFQRASKAKNEGVLDLVVLNTYSRLLDIGLFPMLVLGVIGREVFVVAFGPQWAEAGVYVQIISLWRFFVFIGSPLSTLFPVLERQEIGLAFNIVLLLSRILSLILGGLFGNARVALLLYAASGLVMFAWLLMWLLHASGVSIWKAMGDTGGRLVYLAPTLLLLFAAKYWWQWSAYHIVVLAGTSAFVYYGILIWRDPTLMKFVCRMWQGLRK
ncbi:MAG: oligosaccharide flippase family protein [Candidatus Latescibacterota bacterium]